MQILDPSTAKAAGARQLEERRRLQRIGAPLPKKARTDWKAKYEAERNKVLDEAIAAIRAKQHDRTGPRPESPEGRAYAMAFNSAVTALELLKEPQA